MNHMCRGPIKMDKDSFICAIQDSIAMANREGLIVIAIQVEGETFGVEEVISPYGNVKVKILKND